MTSRFRPGRALALSQRAPAFSIRRAGGSPLLTLEQFEGRPVVLAFIPRWLCSQIASSAMSAVRAELRTLGATLVLVSKECVLCFRPDDDTQRCAATRELDAATLRATCAAYGVDAAGFESDGNAAWSDIALFVIDARARLRFFSERSSLVAKLANVAHAESDQAASETHHIDPTRALADALHTAGQTLQARAELRMPSATPSAWTGYRGELVVSTLVSAFAIAFAAQTGLP